MKSIRNYNKKGERHGYNERYYNGKMIFRGKYINDNLMGYSEWYYIKETIFHIV